MPMQTWLNALFSSLDCEGKKPHRLTSIPFASSLRCAVPFLSSAFLAANLANLPPPAAQSPVSHVVWPLESGIGRGHCCPGALLACWAACGIPSRPSLPLAAICIAKEWANQDEWEWEWEREREYWLWTAKKPAEAWLALAWQATSKRGSQLGKFGRQIG